MQSPNNIRNQGTGFLRKISESEEGLIRKSFINTLKTDVDKAASNCLSMRMSQKIGGPSLIKEVVLSK